MHNHNIFGNSRISKDLSKQLENYEKRRKKVAFLKSIFNDEEWYIATDMLEIIKLFSEEKYLNFLGNLTTILSSLFVPDNGRLILNSKDLFGKELI